MTSLNFSDLDISIPFSNEGEFVTSARYHYDNANRGNEQFVIIQLTESGAGILAKAGGAHRVEAGQAFVAVVPEASRYYFDPAAGHWQFSWINFYGDLAVSYMRAFVERFGFVLDLEPGGEADRQFRLLLGLTRRNLAPDRHEVTVQAFKFLADWRRELATPERKGRDRIAEVRRACETRFREPLGTKGLAAEAGLSREHLAREFRRRHGIPLATYLREVRRREALALMAGGGLPLHEIALRAGFPSVAALQRTLARS